VTGSCELLCASEPGWARANDGNPFTGARSRHDWLDPSLPPTTIDDGAFDRFNRDRIFVDV
jgi:hypothetical protein